MTHSGVEVRSHRRSNYRSRSLKADALRAELLRGVAGVPYVLRVRHKSSEVIGIEKAIIEQNVGSR